MRRFGFVRFNGRDKTFIILPGESFIAASRSWFMHVTSETPFAPQFVSLAPLQRWCAKILFSTTQDARPVSPARTRIHFVRLTRYQMLHYIVPRYSRVRHIIKFCIKLSRAFQRVSITAVTIFQRAGIVITYVHDHVPQKVANVYVTEKITRRNPIINTAMTRLIF